jgi:uncharacterized protein YqhQ
MKKPVFCYGGQAVIEGVMMRGKTSMAVAVRKTPGDILVERWPIKASSGRPKFLSWPLIRGTVNLVDSLMIGVKTLVFSANQSLDEGEEEETLSTMEVAITVAISLVLGIGLFFLLPAFLAQSIKAWVSNHALQNLLEGVVRIVVFLVYIYSISKMKDIQRVFQYHGAEHKTIFTYEAGEALTVDNARRQSRLHPRCGTSFLVLVMVVSIFVFSVLGEMSLLGRLVSRVLLLPVVAGIAYEFIRYAGQHLENPLVAAISWPGLQLQRLTTREPDDSQLEVAIASLKKVLQDDGILTEPETEVELDTKPLNEGEEINA